MLKPNQKVFAISKKGEIKEVEFIKPAFGCRAKKGRENTYYRVYETQEEAIKALSENGGKQIYGRETNAGVNIVGDVFKEIDLLKIKVEILNKQKANKPWYCGIFHALGKKED